MVAAIGRAEISVYSDNRPVAQCSLPRSGEINSLRLKCKLRYKAAIKQAIQHADEEFNDELTDYLCQKEFDSFWKSWRKRFCHSKPKPSNRINSNIGDSNILQEFTHFYKRVGQPNTAGADDRYVNLIADYLQSDKNHSATVSPTDLAVIDDAVRDLPLRKAPGHDGIRISICLCWSMLTYIRVLFCRLEPLYLKRYSQSRISTTKIYKKASWNEKVLISSMVS